MVNTKAAVLVKALSKEYDPGKENAVWALKNVSLEIEPGEFVMITGRNGSGKSTIMHVMALLDEPSDGQVYFGGREVSCLKDKQKMRLRLESLGYIFQEYALIQDLTALENVMLPAMMLGKYKHARDNARELLATVGLQDKMKRLPSQLSGGEQQRVAIARALINRPKIIFADEPTANLDTIASKDVLEIFKKLNKEEKITIIMVSHEQEEYAYASRLIHFRDGKIVKE